MITNVHFEILEQLGRIDGGKWIPMDSIGHRLVGGNGFFPWEWGAKETTECPRPCDGADAHAHIELAGIKCCLEKGSAITSVGNGFWRTTAPLFGPTIEDRRIAVVINAALKWIEEHP